MTRRRKIVLACLLVGVVAGVAAASAVVVRYNETRDVRGSSTVEFVTTQAVPEKPKEPGVAWPTYGYSPDRLKAVGLSHQPPYRVRWHFRARALVEFPPTIAYGRLYFTNAYGRVFAVNARTGKRAWKYDAGRCNASTPTVWEHTIIQSFMSRCPLRGQRRDGELVALYAGWGQVRWRVRIGVSESSPVVVDNVVYLGDALGRVYAIYARTGKLKWVFRTKGPIKGGVAVAGNRLYVGSYDHNVYALNRTTGRLLWKSGAQRRFGRRASFYSTPAAAYGRVYIGGTDGKVYSFGATTGKLRWSKSTGGYVYSSPAVWNKLVFAGSYSKQLFAFDAATGDIRWRFRANGPISGSPTIINGIVYFSTLNERTYALDARTGRLMWQFPDGKYAPIVADAQRVYLTGLAWIYALDRRRLTG